MEWYCNRVTILAVSLVDFRGREASSSSIRGRHDQLADGYMWGSNGAVIKGNLCFLLEQQAIYVNCVISEMRSDWQKEEIGICFEMLSLKYLRGIWEKTLGHIDLSITLQRNPRWQCK